MVDLISDFSLIGKNVYFLNSSDAEFDEYLAAKPGLLDKTSREYMMRIDKAKIIDENLGTIQTDIGITDLRHISTGLKTLLMIHFLEGKHEALVANLNECGGNVLSIIFEELNDSNVTGLLQHTSFDTEKLLSLGVSVNGKQITDELELFAGILWRSNDADE